MGLGEDGDAGRMQGRVGSEEDEVEGGGRDGVGDDGDGGGEFGRGTWQATSTRA